MYPVSDKYKAAIQDSTRQFYYAGEIITKGGIRHPFTNEDIVKGSGYITNQCCGDSEIGLGSVYAAELGITLYSDADRYTLEGADITVSFFLMLEDGDFEEVPMGVFEISEADRRINCIAIKAYDYMLRFDSGFKNTVSSGTAYDVLSLACEKCRVELAHTKEEMEGWENGSELLGIYSENDIETWRDVLYYVAQVLGRFCTINREGKLELRQYGDRPVADIPGTQRFTSSFSDFVTRYTAISSTNSRTQTAEYYALEPDDGLTMNLGINPMLQYGLEQTREKLLLNILDGVSRIRYVPFDSSTIGNPAFDLGDIITFSGGHADGGQITCITKYEFKINGKHTLKCVGKNPRLSQAKSKNDKNITGLLNAVEAGRAAVHTYINASPYTIGDNETEIASFGFASNEYTDAQFHGSILLDISADPVTRSGTARGKASVPDGAGEMAGQDSVFSIEWTDDGQAVVTVSYIINDTRLATYAPVETWHSGKHILNLYYPLNGLEANSYNTFRVLVHITGGTATVGMGQAVCAISGQGVSANQDWDGRLEFYDGIPAVPSTAIMPPAGLLDRIDIHMENSGQDGYHDEFALPGFAGYGLVGFGAQMSVEQKPATGEQE